MLNHKSQITNHKQILNPNSQNSKQRKFGYCIFGNCLLFGICYLCIGIFTNIYALNLEKPKIYFLKGDYKLAISEGEKILTSASKGVSDLDELYYILGLSYLKDGNYLRAADIFEIILKEFQDSVFTDEARLGLGDTYFFRGQFSAAQDCYQELIDRRPHTKLKAQVYSRMSEVALKQGNTQVARMCLDKLKEEFPQSPEIKLNKELFSGDNLYYTVQVGSFSKRKNSENLAQKLIQSGQPAYIQKTYSQGRLTYRVRVGKLKSLKAAQALESELSQQGYPTKIYP